MRISIAFLSLFVSLSSFSGSKNIFLGDGKSPKSAYKVYTIAEEYEILGLFNLKPSKQSLMIIDKEFYDVFEINGRKIYFKLMKKQNYNSKEI